MYNDRTHRELNIHMHGQRLKHDPYLWYLGVTFVQRTSVT